MEVISSGQSTKLTSFENCTLLCEEYKHPNDFNSDISLHSKDCFLLTHKNSNIELIRVVRNPDGRKKIEQIKKLRVDNLYCSAPQKKNKNYAALATIDSIRILNLKNNKFEKKLAIESNNSPIFLDYSNCDEYLSAVFENGMTYIYGLKTGIRSDTITLDKNSCLARFHPTKRFHLSIASLGGSVTVYDIQSKKIHFQMKDAHSAPCKDLCVPQEVPDRLFTVGYDNVVNIYDTRKKTYGMKISGNTPFSSISSTACGTLFVIGSLRGEIISYDIRNLKTYLEFAKPHEKEINRLILYSTEAPGSTEYSDFLSRIESRMSLGFPAADLEAEENNQNVSNVSFMDEILDLQRRGRRSDFSSSYVSRFSIDENRLSTDLEGKKTIDLFNDLSLGNLSLNEQGNDSQLDTSNINIGRLIKRQKNTSVEPKRSSNLTKIQEESNFNTVSSDPKESLDLFDSPASSRPTMKITSSSTPITLNSSAENNSGASVEIISGLTPQSVASGSIRRSEAKNGDQRPGNHEEVVEIPKDFEKHPGNLGNQEKNQEARGSGSLHKLPIETPENPGKSSESLRYLDQSLIKEYFKEEMNEFRKSMDEKFHELHQLFLYDMSTQYFKLQSFMWRQLSKIEEKQEVAHEALNLLLQEDPLVNRALELQKENYELRKMLNEMQERFNN